MPEQRCENCRYWGSDGPCPDELVHPGYCRRFPPIILQDRDGDESIDSYGRGCDSFYPITFHDDWCGEWQPAATA